jgi:hypothetical protein
MGSIINNKYPTLGGLPINKERVLAKALPQRLPRLGLEGGKISMS